MCGIAGYVSDIRRDDARILASLGHRGRDDHGVRDDHVGGRLVHLSHNRLSIIDLSDAGHQPMLTDDGEIALAFNGEVYNFAALRDRHLRGVSLRSRTDTEVVLHLYRVLGPACLPELNGDFAFALLDKLAGKLLLVRDRLGVKPLYYSVDASGSFVFGSEVKALIAAGVRPALNADRLQDFLVFKYVPEADTLFKGVRRIPPAHYLELDLASMRIEIRRYWRLEKKPEYGSFSYRDAQERLRELLTDAIRIRLMSDVPVGVFFSGGIDSSIIAHILKEEEAIRYYTAKKSEKDLRLEGTTSDFYFANRLARRWRLDFHPVDIGAQEANLGTLRDVIRFSDDLIADGSQIPAFLITRESSKSSTVMLSGMGGDELFFGYKGHMLALLARFFDRLPRPMAGTLAAFAANLSQGKGAFKSYRRHLRPFGKYYGRPAAERYGMYEMVGDYEDALSVLKRNGGSSIQIFREYFDNNEDVFDNIVRFELDNFLVKNLHYIDRMCMAHSVEGRVPYLDHRLVELAFSLPRDYKLARTGKTKKILKEAFRGDLPGDVLRRRKAAFGMPLRSIFKNGRMIRQLLDRDFFASSELFSWERIDRLVERHVSGREDTSALLFALISFQEWSKIFLGS